MIKAVFFDFYKTLVFFWPPLDEIQQASCRELGLGVTKEGIRRGYKLADEYMAEENAVTPLAERSDQQRDEFFTEYERRILEGAGLDVSPRLAWQVWKMAIQVPKDFDLFDDVVPALKQLKTRGIVLGGHLQPTQGTWRSYAPGWGWTHTWTSASPPRRPAPRSPILPSSRRPWTGLM